MFSTNFTFFLPGFFSSYLFANNLHQNKTCVIYLPIYTQIFPPLFLDVSCVLGFLRNPGPLPAARTLTDLSCSADLLKKNQEEERIGSVGAARPCGLKSKATPTAADWEQRRRRRPATATAKNGMTPCSLALFEPYFWRPMALIEIGPGAPFPSPA